MMLDFWSFLFRSSSEFLYKQTLQIIKDFKKLFVISFESASQSLLVWNTGTVEVIKGINLSSALRWWLHYRTTKGGRARGPNGCLKALRGLSCTHKEHPIVWKPGSYYSLPAPCHLIHVQLIWHHLSYTRTNTHTQCWLTLSCWMDTNPGLFLSGCSFPASHTSLP